MDINFIIISVVFCAYGMWFTLAVFNNVSDFQTNRLLIAKMMSMEDIKSDPYMGNNLQWRAMNGMRWSPVVFIPVIAYQAFIVFQFFSVGFDLFSTLLSGAAISQNLIVDVSVTFLMALLLWFSFLIGGLCFGYWIKMPQVQTAHILLAILTLFCLTIVNVLYRI
jgi:predicted small integral membrane protein